MPVLRFSPMVLCAALACGAQTAGAEGGSAFQGADLDLGRQLIVEHKCNACHAQKWANDGLAIYRPGGSINSAAKLLSMVEGCNTELGFGLFPEDVAAVAAVLNRDHYHFVD